MIKLPAWYVQVLIFVAAFALFDRSKKSASVFYIKGDDLSVAVKRTAAFRSLDVAFVLVNKIPLLKERIQTGEYAVNKGDTVAKLLVRMFTGLRVRRKFMIPPGWTILRIVQKVQNDNLLFGSISDIPKEGTLMPDTYYYYFGDSKDSIISKARNQMKVVIANLKESLSNTKLTLDEILIMASIIEKETSSNEERSIVSSVFHNRLDKKMKLESDPTVIYAVSGGNGVMSRNLTKNDLKFDSKFNTYRNRGLPPTPICCPDKNSIVAAANPSKTEYVFFVAKPDGGGHNFAKTYDEHLKNVNLFRTSRTK
jgi:UPF0755 protein